MGSQRRVTLSARDSRQLPMFQEAPAPEDPNLRGLARRGDPATSHDAPKDVPLSALQERVYLAFAAHGDMTDEALRMLPEFQEHRRSESTVRKRRSELARMRPPRLIAKGKERNALGNWMTIWGLPDAG